MLDLSNITNPETFLIAISSFLVFIIFLFGEIITDPVPFADDRKVIRKIEGIIFFLLNIIPPVAGAFILIIFLYDLYNLIIARNIQFLFDIFIQLLLLTIAGVVIINFYFIGKLVNRFVYKNMAVTEGKYYYLQRDLFTYFTFFLILIVIVLYYWKGYVYILPTLIFSFFHLLGFAVFSSLKSQNIGIADIYFVNSEEKPIKECRILKVNDDNVKIRKDNLAMIINKNQILKIVENIKVEDIEPEGENQLISYLRYRKNKFKLVKSLLNEAYAYFRKTYQRVQKDT